MKRQIIHFLGDVHGAFGKLNEFIDRQIRKRDVFRWIAHDCRTSGMDFEIIVIQLGDFGYFWPGCDSRGRIDNRMDFLPGGRIRIWWLGGNHEDWDEIDFRLDGRDSVEVDEGITLFNFGSTVRLCDGKTLLFAGGAESVDRDARILQMAQGCGKCWWRQEGISKADMDRLAAVRKADIVVSHTAPMSFEVDAHIAGNGFGHAARDNSSRERLETILDRFRPKSWHFGHFHRRMAGKAKGCRWQGLADLSQGPDAWATLDLEGGWEKPLDAEGLQGIFNKQEGKCPPDA